MDRASPEFCREVAKQLRQATTYPWRAKHSESRKPGFWVVSEYDLDPLEWPVGRVGGVELLTPPLPLDEAERVRTITSEAVEEIDGDYNSWSHSILKDCAWHINVDAEAARLDPETFAYCVDEIAVLHANDRLWNGYAGMQRHAYGPPLLRHLESDPKGILLQMNGMGALIWENCGRTKRYAANFGKLQVGYLELRHFEAWEFFNGLGLQSTLAPITDGLEIPFSQHSPFQDRFLKKLKLTADWLRTNSALIETRFSPANWSHAPGEVRFADTPLCNVSFCGSGDLHLIESKAYMSDVILRGVALADVPEHVALLALDLAELRLLGFPTKMLNKPFAQEVTKLATKLRRMNLTPEEHSRLLQGSKDIRESGEYHAAK